MAALESNCGVKLEVGMTVRVLTTAACESEDQFRKKHKEEKDKDSKEHKGHKHHKESHDVKDHWKDLDGKEHHDWNELGWKDAEDDKEPKECKEHKEIKDPQGIFTGVILGEANLEFKRVDGKHIIPPTPIWVEEKEQYLVLSLTRTSPPFAAGEIISLSFDQIVAIAVVC